MAHINWKDFAEQKRLFNQYECGDGEPGLSSSDLNRMEKEQPQRKKVSRDELGAFLAGGGEEWVSKNQLYGTTVSVGNRRWIKHGTADSPRIVGGGDLIFSKRLSDSQLQSLAIYLRDYARQKGLQVQDNEIQAIDAGVGLTDGLFYYAVQFVTPSCQSPRQPQVLEVPENLHIEVRAFQPPPMIIVPKVASPKQEPKHPVVIKRRAKPLEKQAVVVEEKTRPSPVTSSTSSSGNRDYYLVTVNSKIVWIPADLILIVTDRGVPEIERVKKVGEKIRKATGDRVEISNEELELIMRKPFNDTNFTRFSAL